MIKKTLWKPDTCECEIEYEWDDTQKEDVRIHLASRVIKACEIHKALADKITDHFSVVLEENQRKNKFLAQIIENCPSLVSEIIDANGNVIKKLKSSLEYKWSFDEDRNLEIELTGLSPSEKTIINNLAINFVGGKVKIK